MNLPYSSNMTFEYDLYLSQLLPFLSPAVQAQINQTNFKDGTDYSYLFDPNHPRSLFNTSTIFNLF